MSNSTNQPVVSILMTAFNRESFIDEAIQSVIESEFQDWELIIVDDCSKDSTFKRASMWEKVDGRIRVYKNTVNLGDYVNRNEAARYARGEFIKYLDSDDIIYPHGLKVMVESMRKFPSAAFGLSSLAGSRTSLPEEISPREAYIEHFNGFGHFNRAPGSGIIRRSVFESLGGFSGKRMIGDFELWLKLSKNHSMVKFQRDLVWDRVHAGQESKTEYAAKYDRLKKSVLKEQLEDSECPLSAAERKYFLRFAQKQRFKKRIFKLLKVYNLYFICGASVIVGNC